jgi:preprotein translocase subunit YajC
MSIFATTTGSTTGSLVMLIAYIVIFAGFMYFVLIRPQKKQQAKVQAMVDAMEPGDSVMTTSGFYGVVIGIEEDTVIVEFGNNKNCRIPMQKSAITEVEKATKE